MEPEDPENYLVALCIFCYKTTDDNDNNSSNFENDNYKGFFSLIARHFHNSSNAISEEEQEWWIRNAWKVISEFNSGNEEEGDDKPTTSTRLVICNTCKIITEKWCELYDKVKQLELLMDWEISKLWNVMRYADSDEMMTCQKGKKILEECSSSQELPLKDLRKSLKQSFEGYQNERMKESFPRLNLSPVKSFGDLEDNLDPASLIKLEDTASDYFEDDDQNEPGMQDWQENSLEEELGETGSVHNKNGLPTTTVTTIKRKRTFQQGGKRKMVKVEQDHKCPSCEKIFKKGYKLRYHQSQKHPELFFRDSFSNISVQYVLEKILRQDFTKLKKNSDLKKEKKAGAQTSRKCGFCSRVMSCRSRAKSHLILKHRKIVEEKLNEFGKISEKKSANEMKEEVKKLRRKDKPLFKCDHCSRPSFNDKSKLFHHLITHHLEIYFENGRLENISGDRFKDYLNYLLRINVENVWKTFTKGKCQFCEQICLGRRYAKSHLIMKHFQILRDKLVGLQKEFGENGPPPISVRGASKLMKKTIKLTKLPKMKIIKRARSEGEREEDRKCKICGKVLRAAWDLRHHQSQTHPEAFFPQKFSKTRIAYVLEKQVDEHFTKAKATATPVRKYVFKCEICGHVLHNRLNAKSHLVLVHREIMVGNLERLGESGKDLKEIEEELEEIKKERYRKLKDPLEKKEIVWKCEGEEGGCGKVFSSKYALQRHRERHCEVVGRKGRKGRKRRVIQKDLNLKVEQESESRQGEVMDVGASCVKREEFENEEAFVILSEMDIDGDEDGHL